MTPECKNDLTKLIENKGKYEEFLATKIEYTTTILITSRILVFTWTGGLKFKGGALTLYVTLVKYTETKKTIPVHVIH